MLKRGIVTKLLAMAALICASGFGQADAKAEEGREAPYYNINVNGGSFDGNQYVLDDGTVVTDAFFCDGQYTYYLESNGEPMKNRLTYHPNGKNVIYFDENGHEVFNNFAHVTRSVEGNEVDDYCYFDVYGYMYVNVITYDSTGTNLYYINPYGVMEHTGVFNVDANATNYCLIANGCSFGYANADGTIREFYKTKEDAENNVTYEYVEGEWQPVSVVKYAADGSVASRVENIYNERGLITEEKYYALTYDTYEEYLYEDVFYTYDADGNLDMQTRESYGKSPDGVYRVWLRKVEKYDTEGKLITHTSYTLDYYNKSGEGYDKIVSSCIYAYSYDTEYTEKGYKDIVTEDRYSYKGNLETLVSCFTIKDVMTYENGRLIKEENKDNYGGGGFPTTYEYEYQDGESVYNPESGTTDTTNIEKCYYTGGNANSVLFYDKRTTYRMKDEKNGTKTENMYNENGNITGTNEYQIIDGEEKAISKQNYKMSLGSAYMYIEDKDANIVKEYHDTYGVERWNVVATPKNTTPYLRHPSAGDTISINTQNTYIAKWIKLNTKYEEGVEYWNYEILPDEEWKQQFYEISTYKFFAK